LDGSTRRSRAADGADAGSTVPAPAPSGTVLDLRGLSKSFGPVRALDRVSVAVARGTIHGVVGQNGAGKSTLMQILAGVFPPDDGEVVLAGEPIAPRDPDQARRLGIRIIFQELNLVPYQTVAENVSLGVEPRTRLGLLDRRAMRRRAEALLDELGHPLPVDAKVDALDVSEQQIVEIAKALAADARLLILDEPTAALQIHDVDRLFRVLRRFRRRGGTALYVSHRLDEIFELCDRVTVLRDGRVIATLDVAGTDKAEIIGMMIGRPLAEVFPERSLEDGAPVVLEARGIGSDILRDVTFETRAGRILGIVGLEGSGIHELGRVLVGDTQLTGGELRIGGRAIRIASPRHALRAGVVYLSADRKTEGMFPILSVAHNIALGTLADRRRLGLVNFRAERALVARSIANLQIRTSGPGQEIRFLSGGNQQKALLARCLAARPRLFVLDEPTRGIDVGGKADLYGLIRSLAQSGAAVAMISTELTEILGMSDEVLVLRKGRVAATLPGGATESEVLGHIL
jgi:ribose transport system ATP-binding protein